MSKKFPKFTNLSKFTTFPKITSFSKLKNLLKFHCFFLYVKTQVAKFCGLRGIGKHLRNGSPVKLFLHEHMGLWFKTLQFALRPQRFGQGSMHFWLMQAREVEHSELTTHSGRQAGGDPTYSGLQEHTPWPFTTRHWLFGPQGDGLQGSVGSGGNSEDL